MTDYQKIVSVLTGSCNKSTLSYEECINKPFPHNERCRFTTGFHCENCGNFYSKESEEYALHEGNKNPLRIQIHIHNIIVDMYRSEGEIESKKYLRYKRRLNKISKHYNSLIFSPKENKWVVPEEIQI